VYIFHSQGEFSPKSDEIYYLPNTRSHSLRVVMLSEAALHQSRRYSFQSNLYHQLCESSSKTEVIAVAQLFLFSRIRMYMLARGCSNLAGIKLERSQEQKQSGGGGDIRTIVSLIITVQNNHD